MKKNNKFKGYHIVDDYPEDGWLKGYFYAKNDDIRNAKEKTNKAYQDIAYIRHKDYILHLLDIKTGEKILDVGCATGAMMVYCGLLGGEVYGIDTCAESINKAEEYLSRHTIKGYAIEGDARKIYFPDNYFDKVVSCDFFEHVYTKDKILVLEEIKRVLKPGGVLVIKTPNLTYLRFSKFLKQVKMLMKLKNPFNVIIPHTTGYNTEHVGLITAGKMAQVLKSAGIMNFRFQYDINSKLERINYTLGQLFAETPLLKTIFTEDLIVVAQKPIILSFFP